MVLIDLYGQLSNSLYAEHEAPTLFGETKLFIHWTGELTENKPVSIKDFDNSLCAWILCKCQLYFCCEGFSSKLIQK